MMKQVMKRLTLLCLSAACLTPARAATPAAMKREKAPEGPAVTDILYYADSNTLKVSFANGRERRYAGVPMDLAEEFCAAEDKTGFFRRQVEEKFKTARAPASSANIPVVDATAPAKKPSAASVKMAAPAAGKAATPKTATGKPASVAAKAPATPVKAATGKAGDAKPSAKVPANVPAKAPAKAPERKEG